MKQEGTKISIIQLSCARRVLGSFFNSLINPDNSSARRLESLKNIFKLTELHKWQIPESYCCPNDGCSRLFPGYPTEGSRKLPLSWEDSPPLRLSGLRGTWRLYSHRILLMLICPAGLSQTSLEPPHFWSVTLPKTFPYGDCSTLNLSLLLNKIWPQEDAVKT